MLDRKGTNTLVKSVFAYIFLCCIPKTLSFIGRTENPRHWPSATTQKRLFLRSFGILNAERTGGLDFAELKDSVDIVTAIESFELDRFERKGADKATALCPFHDDRNPSLIIDSNRQAYKCFSCGAGGDIFRFVQEYSKLQGEELSFFEAALKVNEKFGDGTIAANFRGGSRESPEIRKRKERIMLANAAASMFYIECLSKPSAGSARSHIRDRGLAADSIRSFGIGYAPDAYFGFGKKWGEGSMTNYLMSLNFTAEEIVDAGLAITTKNSEIIDAKSANETGPLTFEQIMDRFRGRLMVPIVDKTGQKVLGFGGRILDNGMSTSNGYAPPKYLNSPESLVFSKKDIVFGFEMARKELKSHSDENALADQVVVVEGYMDAISLWNIGIRSAVATMGTAISLEQLSLAAQIVGTGRILLCMDQDEAGRAAVERICANGILSALSQKFAAEVRIATIPGKSKDPAEFIETRKSKSDDSIVKDFIHDVVDEAVEWKKWYLKSILDRYDESVPSGRPNSFANIFDRIGSFLGTIPSPGDRTRYAYQVSSTLAEIMAKESGASSPSSAVQSQLESDLISLASRTAESRAMGQKRAEAVADTAKTGAARPAGHDNSPSFIVDEEKLSWKALRSASVRPSNQEPEVRSRNPQAPTQSNGKQEFRITKKAREDSLTPHFSGLSFAYETDAEWLGLGKNAWGVRKNGLNVLDEATGSNKGTKPVYFNSNEYHGQRFLTSGAMEAGYDARGFRPDPSFLKKGIGSLMERNHDEMVGTAQFILLKLLAQFPSTRLVIRDLYSARNAVMSGVTLRWSGAEQKWLFAQLVEGVNEIPDDALTGESLKEYLTAQPDCPPGTFTQNLESDESETNPGKLNMLFDTASEAILSKEDGERRCDAYVEEVWSTFLLSSTSQYVAELKEELVEASQKMESHFLDNDEEMLLDGNETKSVIDDEALKQDQIEVQRLANAMRDQSQQLQMLTESANRVSKRIMDDIIGGRAEGKYSPAHQAELAARVSQFVSDIAGSPEYQEPDTIIASSDFDGDEEPYETTLEKIDSDWGEWADRDYVWDIDHANEPTKTGWNPLASVIADAVDEEDSEVLEDTLERISEDWADWID